MIIQSGILKNYLRVLTKNLIGQITLEIVLLNVQIIYSLEDVHNQLHGTLCMEEEEVIVIIVVAFYLPVGLYLCCVIYSCFM